MCSGLKFGSDSSATDNISTGIRAALKGIEEALKGAGLKGELRDFAQTSLGHERQHLAAIRQALGAKALPKPAFDFGQKTKSARAFAQASIDLEDIAVAAYNGQAPNLTKGTLAAAATIVSVEARHAAWVRAILGEVAAPDPGELGPDARLDLCADQHGEAACPVIGATSP